MVRFLLLAGSKGGGVLDACVDSRSQAGVVERKWNLLDIEVATWISIEEFFSPCCRICDGLDASQHI